MDGSKKSQYHTRLIVWKRNTIESPPMVKQKIQKKSLDENKKIHFE